MTTDNKTLADVQPGGRVRLGDQAERARFEAWAEDRELGTAKCSADGMKGDYADLNTDWCWAAWRAALSAQPSPGGQGELAALVSKWRNEASAYDDQQAKETGFEVDWTYDAKARALDRAADELEAALAARQPVGISADWVLSYLDTDAPEESREAIRNAFAEYAALSGARQPVGEPVAWMIERLRGKGYVRDKYVVMKGQPSSDPGSHLFWADQQARDNHRVTPLYASHAQAVDLGRARASIQSLLNWIDDWAETPEESGIDAIEIEAAAVLDLIDSQAVGK